MATATTIKKNIAKLEAALKSKATPKSLKPKLETQLVKSKAELSGMNKGTKPKTSSTKSTQTALQKLKAMVNKNKKYKTYKGAGVDLEKDADRPALRTGKRIAKESGKTYYEYRANRIDVKQPPKKYPKLEKGGYMAKGGAVMIPRKDLVIGEISSMTGLRKEGIEIFANDYELTDSDLSNIMQGLGRKMISKDDFSTAVVGNKDNSYATEIVEFAKSGKGYKMAKGGKVGMAEWAVTITSEDGESYDWDGFAKSEDDALDKAEKEAGFGSVESSVVMITDENGEKIEYAKGGISDKEVAESNAEMVLSQIKAVKHHAQELSNVVSKNSDIEAWVVAKIERASTDLSDITHYLEFQTKKMAMGGEMHRSEGNTYSKGGSVDPEKYPELQKIADKIADETAENINKEVKDVKSNMPYKAQWVLEEVVKDLKNRI